MKQRRILFLVVVMILSGSANVFAQTGQLGPKKKNTYKVAIVAPLYLDSVFSGNYYKYGKGFPAFAMAGFDFVQGASMAVNNFSNDSVIVEAKVYDSKATVYPLSEILNSNEMRDVKLIIGSAKDQDYFQLAKFAADKKIPFVSATYPNDAGIKNDPYLIIHNSTLQTHCETIFTHLLTNYGTEKIVFVRRPDARGDMVSEIFAKLNSPDKNKLLNLDLVTIEEGDYTTIASHLDSSKSTLVIGASLNAEFCAGLVKYLTAVKNKYPSKIIGMPTWEGINFNAPAYKDYEIMYTTNYHNPKNTATAKSIANLYKQNFKGNASDVVFKAYDVTSYFLSVLKDYPDSIMEHINQGTDKVFTNPIYFPNYTDINDIRPNFYENRRAFFLKKLNGTTSRVW
jgi:hypothetical protein